jgi:hypothetical protein
MRPTSAAVTKVGNRKRSEKPTDDDAISPELAAKVVKEYVLPMLGG